MRMVMRACFPHTLSIVGDLMLHVSDLEKLRMWEPLQGLLASSSNDIKVQALWVIGTAMQNNPAAQKAVRSSLLPPTRNLLAA